MSHELNSSKTGKCQRQPPQRASLSDFRRGPGQHLVNAMKQAQPLVNKVAELGMTNQAEAVTKVLLVDLRPPQRLTKFVTEITAASSEQTSGIEQINTAIIQMDQTTQQNAALVEQAAAAALALKEQVSRLTRAVSIFKLA